MSQSVTDVVKNLYFTLTTTSKRNLLRVNKKVEEIIITVNTIIDALFSAANKVSSSNDFENLKITISLLN